MFGYSPDNNNYKCWEKTNKQLGDEQKLAETGEDLILTEIHIYMFFPLPKGTTPRSISVAGGAEAESGVLQD